MPVTCSAYNVARAALLNFNYNTAILIASSARSLAYASLLQPIKSSGAEDFMNTSGRTEIPISVDLYEVGFFDTFNFLCC